MGRTIPHALYHIPEAFQPGVRLFLPEMSRVVDSPFTRWPGSVTLCDYLTLPQIIAWRNAWRHAETFTHSNGESQVIDDPLEYRRALLPGALGCFESFALTGLPQKLTPDNFPGAPGLEAGELANWLFRIVACEIAGEESIPKNS